MKWGIMVMKSRTSFINPGILRNDFKSLGWIGAAYLLGMLLSLPLKILMLHSRLENTPSYDSTIYLRIFQFESPLQLMLLALVPILAGLWLFRYLQTDKAADMLHALPVQRATLYNTHILAGLIFLAVPLIITALVSWALVAGLGITSINAMAVLSWLGISLLINLLFFMTCVATGMFTGISVVQGVLSYILLVLPAGLSMLVLHNMKMYVYGFAYDYYSTTSITNLSPLIRLFDSVYRHPMQNAEIAIYVFTSIALYLLGRYLYQRRQLETAGNAITFGLLRPFFKYGVTFCSMLLLGSYYKDTQNTIAWTYFGYFLGALLAYFLVEILLTKSLRVFHLKNIKHLGIYTLVVVGLISALNFDLVGYEKRIPNLADVESIYLDNSFYALNEHNRPRVRADMISTPINTVRLPVYSQTDNVRAIWNLHQDILNKTYPEKPLNFAQNNTRQERICLVYNLKDGSHFYRQYSVPVMEYATELKPIYETREYKDAHYPILGVNTAVIKMIEIHADADVDKNVRISDPQLIEQAIKAFQADVVAQTYAEMTSELPSWANITMLIDTPEKPDMGNQNLHLSWQKSYRNFEQWLKDINQYNNARIIPGEDLKYAMVARRNKDNNNNQAIPKAATERTQQAIADLEKNPENLKISDPDQLETCLRTYGYDYRQSSDGKETIYDVFFLMKNGRFFAGGFTENSAPSFVKEHFSK